MEEQEKALEEVRGTCEMWDEELGCLDTYPAECSVAKACEKDAVEPED